MRYAYKVLPTEYMGITYRSRLEARWAVFFSEMNYSFSYEPEGIAVCGGYRPDFLLKLRLDDTPHEYSVLAEVKPDKFTDVERDKCLGASLHTGMPIFLLADQPSAEAYDFITSWSAAAGYVDTVPALLPCLGTGMRVWHGAYSSADLEKLGEDYAGAVCAARNERFENRSRRRLCRVPGLGVGED